MANLFNALWSLVPSLARGGRGAVVKGHRVRPEKRLVLYDGEFCPYCRYVREALTELDLDVMIYPVPKKGMRFRHLASKKPGEHTVPFLVDPNTGESHHHSEEIVQYLYDHYGPEGARRPRRLIYLSLLATMLRFKKGMFARPSKPAEKPLELYSFEASPYARLVRETLCELEVPYLLHNVGKGRGKPGEWLPPGARKNYVGTTENRRKLVERGGQMMVPYLVDPNTGVAMYESAEIQRYLLKTYGA